MSERELEELKRINGNKCMDNDELKTKMQSNKDLLRVSENDYYSLRE
jgi:hypothetical protein